MKKLILALILILPITLALTGCVKSNKNKLDDQKQRTLGNRNFDNSKMFEKLNLEKIALVDLKIGDKVSVFGPSNSDGSINAERIILGDLTEIMKSLVPAPVVDADKTTETKNPTVENNQPPIGNQDWQNNHPEGQTGFRGEDNGQGRGGMMAGKGQGAGMMNRANRIVGEIIKIENNTITLKLSEGGSKNILINDKTEISKLNASENK